MSLKIDKNFENLIIKYINQNTKTEDLKLLLTYLNVRRIDIEIKSELIEIMFPMI